MSNLEISNAIDQNDDRKRKESLDDINTNKKMALIEPFNIKEEVTKRVEILKNMINSCNKYMKYSLVIGYVGTEYKGCQGQYENALTIENQLEKILLKMEAIRGRNDKNYNLCLSRCARTDNGVHALNNIFVYSVNICCTFLKDDIQNIYKTYGENNNLGMNGCDLNTDNMERIFSSSYNNTELDFFYKLFFSDVPEIPTRKIGMDNVHSNKKNKNFLDIKNKLYPYMVNRIRDFLYIHKNILQKISKSENNDNESKNGSNSKVDHFKELQEHLNLSNYYYRERNVLEDEFIKYLNKNLPRDIYCLKVFKVTKSFDARKFCSFRMYEYMLPASIFSEVTVNEKYKDLYENAIQEIKKGVAKTKSDNSKNENTDTKDDQNSQADDKNLEDNTNLRKDNFNINAADFLNENESLFFVKNEKKDLTNKDINRLYDIISKFIGLHNFHNFTNKRNPHVTYRYLKYIEVAKLKLFNENFVSIKFLGQSFLLHQIRKMMSLVIEIFRNSTCIESIDYCFNTKEHIPICLVPPHGLILLYPFYTSYNMKICSPPETLPICLTDEKMSEYLKTNVICKKIFEGAHSKEWSNWVNSINRYSFIYYFMKKNIK